jgi:hypothetical protein
LTKVEVELGEDELINGSQLVSAGAGIHTQADLQPVLYLTFVNANNQYNQVIFLG